MEKISTDEFLIRQPSFPERTQTDSYYIRVADRLLEEIGADAFGSAMPAGLARRLALSLTGYIQDVVADAGLWRSFVDACRELYGFSVPFHTVGEEYVDYELNREDVRFMTWYVIAMLWEDRREIYPHDAGLLALADRCFAVLEEIYDDAPVPEGFNLAQGLEFNDPDDRAAIYRLGNWLFLHSWLLTPAFSVSLREVMGQVPADDPDFTVKVNGRLEEAMLQDTTGPLALFTPEWVYLMIERRLPHETPEADAPEHKYYTAFTAATGGEDIRFFDSYEAMNEFFISALGWEAGKEHLAQAKGAHDYVLMVNPHKGMLMARDIARCLKAPGNPLYDEAFARENSFDLLTVRGLCPGDLLHRALKEGWLPYAHFPGSDDYELVKANADFIARCYLQLYYRGD